MKALLLKAGREKSVKRRHPWIFSGAVERVEGRDAGTPASGETVLVKSADGQMLALAAWSPQSQIRARVWSFDLSVSIDKKFFREKVQKAVALRASLPAAGHTNAMRLVHGESDGLPGLVVDRYADVLVAQFLSAGAEHWREAILDALAEATSCEAIYERSDAEVRTLEGLESKAGFARGNRQAKRCPIIEHGLNFRVDVEQGQKTGFFLDQRENRAALERLCRGKTVLDTFAYTGAFSVYAARGGASEVTSIDVSRPALRASNENLRLNHAYRSVAAVRQHLIEGDVFDVLKRLAAQRARFDVVVLDPPAFAKTRLEVNAAMAAYEGMTKLGLEVLRPGGVLVASSCSSHVSDETFFSAMHRAARAMRRPLEELQRTGHPLDHPVGFAEGAYLKCLFAVAAG